MAAPAYTRYGIHFELFTAGFYTFLKTTTPTNDNGVYLILLTLLRGADWNSE